MIYAANFERLAIRILCSSYVSDDILSQLLDSEASFFEYSGSGYFLYFKHEKLPKSRIICDLPKLKGEWEGVEAGFLVFLGDNELVLECHSWGEVGIPENYRDKPVSIYQIKI
ncbi:hypothetical protein FLL45_08790 [Aliikangiella marina]|uniref:Uncharacterized protein n=1 Tax=Aliikangiella marina TaxID=1712262 RepID=A0A545TCT3_9GAMM|nr:hypothetical protein [Aliikangiella marina]TQV75028.1 hypothetical protein FLL45_08790 [Aliikangiella marina]